MTSLRVMDGNLNDRTWINISESRYELGISKRENFPTNLYLKKRVNSPYFYASWMPDKEDDYRVTNKKRTPLESSTGTADAITAAIKAINWVKQKQRDLLEKVNEYQEVKTKCLAHYWEEYFQDFCLTRASNKSATKMIRDEKLKWHSPTYGLEKESFSRIRVDQINRKHLKTYFLSLSNGMKSQQKTIIKALFNLAESDFVGHQFPSFPKITKPQKEQAVHFEFDDWQTLMKTINELSRGAARSSISFEEYKNLEVKKANRMHQRNWVDLFDALWVNYYWFLRSQDCPRLKIEWFTENAKNKEFIFRNLEPKSGRKIENTKNLNDDAYSFFKRLLKRRPTKGWLIMPFEKRKEEGGQDNIVTRNLNFLLKKAVEECLPEFDTKDAIFTNVRHTTFRHHLEDEPKFGQYPDINWFASNGLTSPQMLQDTYLKYISKETSLNESKKKMRHSDYSLIKRVAA